MKKLVIKQFVNEKGLISTSMNKFIKDKKLTPTDISKIDFSSDHKSAILVYVDDNNQVEETNGGEE